MTEQHDADDPAAHTHPHHPPTTSAIKSTPGRVVALDIGSKRIGVATCDPDRIVTRIVGVVQASPEDMALRRILAIVEDEEAVLILVGFPLTLRGEVGPQAQRINVFVERLKAATPIPIELYDERFTSSEARRVLEERRPLTREERRQGVVDQLAARLLLDDYLQEQRIALGTRDAGFGLRDSRDRWYGPGHE